MKKIPLTRGKFSVVDDSDYDSLAKWNWQAWLSPQGNWYARRWHGETRKVVYMHRELCGFPTGKLVDHRNMDTLDNQRKNLRLCSKSQNNANSVPRSSNKAGVKGVRFLEKRGRWLAQIKAFGKNHFLGHFLSCQEAAKAYKQAAEKLFGEFARTSYPQKTYE